jgi:hypothetical protein
MLDTSYLNMTGIKTIVNEEQKEIHLKLDIISNLK